MKKLFTTITLGCVLIASGCTQQNQQSASLYQYPFKTAIIEYAIKGTTEGSSKVTIKGDKSVREAHITYHKPTGDEKQDNLFIDTGKYNYSVDLDKKVASMTPNPFYTYFMGVAPSQRQDYLKKIALGIDPEKASTQQISSTGTETVAGQTCETYQMQDYGKMCLWNGIPLKTNISLPSFGLTNNTVATSIQTDINVPDSTFDVPTDITVQKAGIEEATQQTPVSTSGQSQQ